jgi:signal transduction histidine kinase
VSRRSLYARIAAFFAVALFTFSAVFGWLSFEVANRHQHEVLQRLNQSLAASIATNGGLAGSDGLKKDSVEGLFHMLMVVNPNIEVYLLDTQGTVIGFSPTSNPVVLDRIALEPVRQFLEEPEQLVLGDNPRNANQRAIFSAAPVTFDGRRQGYIYIVLLNSEYQRLIDQMQGAYALHSALWMGGAVLLLSVLAGLAAFVLITRRLNRLTNEVEDFERRTFDDGSGIPEGLSRQDEIVRLTRAFERLKRRLTQQMDELRRQDTLRRELVANVSHDLRTPLTAMQSCLETLQRVGGTLDETQQQRYLHVAVKQSHQVARLAQQLFELAQLELEDTLPQTECFSISELIQDIAQKYTPVAESARLCLGLEAQPDAPFVRGDIGLIERVITNFADNAIRHTPPGGQVRLEALSRPEGVEVRVADTGSGIAAEHLDGLFRRNSPLRQVGRRRSGGLGLLIAHRILALHGIAISVHSEPGKGTCFSFVMPAAAS